MFVPVVVPIFTYVRKTTFQYVRTMTNVSYMKQCFMKEILYRIANIFRVASVRTKKMSNLFYGYYIIANVTRPTVNINRLIDWTRISGSHLDNEFIYKDESWNQIRCISQFLALDFWKLPGIPWIDNECKNNRVIFAGKNISIHSMGKTPNRWIFLLYKKTLGNIYSITYDITIFSIFKEIQFGFNYETIAKRVRFMIVDNKNLVFEVVENGTFYLIQSVPLSLKLGIKYHIRIEVIKDSFFYYVDDVLVMSLSSHLHEAKNNQKIAFIFWENKNEREIKVLLDNISIFTGNSFPLI